MGPDEPGPTRYEHLHDASLPRQPAILVDHQLARVCGQIATASAVTAWHDQRQRAYQPCDGLTRFPFEGRTQKRDGLAERAGGRSQLVPSGRASTRLRDARSSREAAATFQASEARGRGVPRVRMLCAPWVVTRGRPRSVLCAYLRLSSA
jgi:hypothetical protein